MVGQDIVEGHFCYFVVRPRWDRDPIPQLAGSGQSMTSLYFTGMSFGTTQTDTNQSDLRSIQGNHVTSEAQATQIVSQIRFSGLTPLGTSLDQKILQPMLLNPARAGQLKKPLLVIVISDGAPAGKPRNRKSVFEIETDFVRPVGEPADAGKPGLDMDGEKVY